MFNFTGSATTENIWSRLGTFFKALPPAEKKQLENYWQGLADANQAAYHTLSVLYNSQFLSHDEGFLELLFNDLNIVIEDLNGEGRENATKEFLKSPLNAQATATTAGVETYFYKIASSNSSGESIPTSTIKVSDSALVSELDPINISWDASEGAEEYKVYARKNDEFVLLKTVTGTSTVDDGSLPEDPDKTYLQTPSGISSYVYKYPGNYYVLSVPTLINKKTKVELEESTDYSISNMSHIKFPYDTSAFTIDNSKNIKNAQFLSKTSIVISPIIALFYFSIFSKEPRKTIINKRLTSKRPDLNTLPKKDQEIAYAEHLKYFTWAYSNILRKSPTISTIKKLLAMSCNYPFAYKAGQVTDVVGSVITINSNGEELKYDILDETKHVFELLDEVKQFDILRKDIKVEDFYSNPTLVLQKAEEFIDNFEDYQEQFFIYLNASNAFSPDNALVDQFIDVAIPAGLTPIKEV